MISYIVEIDSLYKFDAWSGGRSLLNVFKNHPRVMDYLNDYLEEWSQDCSYPLTDIDINDFLWFDAVNLLVEEGYIDENMNWTDKNDPLT